VKGLIALLLVLLLVTTSCSTTISQQSGVPRISITPNRGPIGTSVQVTGSGFAANESGIIINFNGMNVSNGTITAGTDGRWNGRFYVPNVIPGNYPVDAYGNTTSGDLVNDVNFTVTGGGVSIQPPEISETPSTVEDIENTEVSEKGIYIYVDESQNRVEVEIPFGHEVNIGPHEKEYLPILSGSCYMDYPSYSFPDHDHDTCGSEIWIRFIDTSIDLGEIKYRLSISFTYRIKIVKIHQSENPYAKIDVGCWKAPMYGLSEELMEFGDGLPRANYLFGLAPPDEGKVPGDWSEEYKEWYTEYYSYVPALTTPGTYERGDTIVKEFEFVWKSEDIDYINFELDMSAGNTHHRNGEVSEGTFTLNHFNLIRDK